MAECTNNEEDVVTTCVRTCETHPHKELSFFCKTCRKFICISCGNTSHHGHEWDRIESVAHGIREETRNECHRIRHNIMPAIAERLSDYELMDLGEEQRRNQDFKKLEDRRKMMIDMVNEIIDEKKRKYLDLSNADIQQKADKRNDIEKKISNIEEMATCLDDDIGEYSDYNLLAMEQEMLSALEEVESCDVDSGAPSVVFVPGEINEEAIEEMVGGLEEIDITKALAA